MQAISFRSPVLLQGCPIFVPLSNQAVPDDSKIASHLVDRVSCATTISWYPASSTLHFTSIVIHLIFEMLRNYHNGHSPGGERLGIL